MSDTLLIDVSTLAVTDTQYNIAKDLASDFLSGCYEDYLFFCSGSDTLSASQTRTVYFLLIGNLSIDNQNYFLSSDCKAYQITVICDTSHSVESDLDFSGNTYEVDPSPVSRFSGGGSVFSPAPRFYTSYSLEEYDVVRVSSQVSTIFYSSLSDYPHLTEGVTFYAYAAFVFAFVVIGFKLADRLFRRVY